MVLLTQSQVSVLISGTIISLFTFALFLSGYVLQQRTVTDIRAAIRPSVQNFAQNLDSAPHIPPQNLDLPPVQPPPLVNAVSHKTSKEQVPVPKDGEMGEPAGAREHKGDFLAEYYDKDAERQLSHEKLPYIIDASLDPSATQDGQISAKLSHIAHLQEQTYATAASFLQRIDSTIHAWIRRIRNQPLEDWELAPDWDEKTPIEQLSAQQRRRRIKMDIRRLGVVEDGELRAVYRPRRRTGKAS